MMQMVRRFSLFSLAGLLVLAFAAFGFTQTRVQAADGACPNSLPARLTVGSAGHIAESFSTARNVPGGAPIQVVYAPAQFTVIAGPACANGYTYWQIRYDGSGLTGWALESEVYSPIYGANRYWLAPGPIPAPPPTPTAPPPAPTATPAPPAPPDCSRSLAPGLTVGGTGRIAERFSTLRNAPGGAAVQVIYAPRTFTVTGGPACANGYVFFEIDYGGGLKGWALESEAYNPVYGANKRWLIP
ncbi:MAG: hypothetical protein KC547_13920 [Anaerolineae bacterium]|nr:hypothetical protein [Anaerolineae bacterium]